MATTERKLLPDTIDSKYLEQLRKWERGAAAALLDERVRKIERSSKVTFIELGMILSEVDEREYWKEMPCPKGSWSSFDRWLSDAAPMCRTSAYSALKAIRELKDVPTDELMQMPRCNVGLLAKVPKHKRNETIIKAAKTESEEKFTERIEKTVPEAHVEAKKPMRFKPEKSLRSVVDKALEMAMALNELSTREEGLEVLASNYIEDHQEEYEEKFGMVTK